jgi:Cu(I)/Ag(I) efflux system membrane fusion protein
MALIPVPRGDDGEDDGGPPRLSVSERAAALMSVQVWPAERMAVEGEARLFGTVAYDETLLHDVVVRAEGQVSALHVNYENATVTRGQPLAEMYSPAVEAASLELLQATQAAGAGGFPALVGAAAAQLAALGVSQLQVDAVLAGGEPLRTFTVFSPGDGVVTELSARQGEWLGAGARLMRVAGVSTVWASMEAFEADLARLRVGTPVELAVDALPGRSFKGTVSFVGPVVDAGRRTVQVRAQLANTDGALKPGMLLRGRVGGGGRGAALMIPATAPLVTGRRALVYVRLRDTERPTFEAREVTLGPSHGAWREVTSGLEEGELVVVNGAFRIDSELQIRGRPSLMSAGGEGAARGGGHVHPAAARPGSEPGRAGPAADVVSSLSEAGGREMASIVQAYLDLAVSLSRDDAEAARTAARALTAALDGATLGGLSGASGAAWSAARRDLSARASAMARAADIAAMRRELRSLSEGMEEAVRTFPSGQVGPLYRAICPMVEGGTGSWLTREPKVENPYWGAAMFSCGEIQGKVSG